MTLHVWDVAPCSLIETNRRFGGAYYLHHQGDYHYHHRPDDEDSNRL
jgi:hypothetical protein